MKLQNHLPEDHRLLVVHRFGAGLSGLVLLLFGLLGFLDDIPFFSTSGERVAGLTSNGLLSTISVVVGILLIAGAVVGGGFASTLNITVGVLFILSGLLNLALMQTPANFLAFRLPNVFFSFVVGLLVMTFGMYGRVGFYLPHTNPYWRARHPEEARAEDLVRASADRRAKALR